jgi:uncharacterized repeat protein (TIGR01451 family)
VQSSTADLKIEAGGPESTSVKTEMAFHLVVTNQGPSDADHVAVVDFLPAQVTFLSASVLSGEGECQKIGAVVACDLGPMAVQSVRTIEILVRGPLRPGDISHQAFVAASTPDPNSDNNADSWTSTILPLPPTWADLRVTKAGPDTVFAREHFSYTVEILNLGGGAANQIAVTDTLPLSATFIAASVSSDLLLCDHGEGVVNCTLDTLPAYQTESVTITVRAPEATGLITNSVQATAQAFDPDLADNEDSATTTVEQGPDPVNINAWIALDQLQLLYRPTPVEGAPHGIATVDMTFINTSTHTLDNIFFAVAWISHSNLVLNADGGPAGQGAVVTLPPPALGEDFLLTPGEAFTVTFQIALQAPFPFYLDVDAYAVPDGDEDGESVDATASFRFEVTESLLLPHEENEIYLPSVEGD